MTTAQRPDVKGKQGTNRGHTQKCSHPDYIQCLCAWGKAWPTLAEIMGGCNCPCHFTTNGVQIPYGAWVAPGQREPIGVLHAIRLEKIEDKEGDDTWLL
jgi:hypothetical protein